MAHYDIFRHYLSIKFPAYGHALWEPNPGNLYPAVEVGDVGYIREGKFRRLFNVLLPANHPSHRNFGVPEYHEQLTLNIENHIDVGVLGPHNFYSAGVTLGGLEPDLWSNGPKKSGEVTFSCPVKEGAVLCLPIGAKREDTVANTKFGKWIIKHIDRWFAWARQLELGVNRMEDIVLVTGTHRTRSCTNVAFPGGQEDAQALFGAKVDHHGDVVAVVWQFSHERSRGAVLNCGPSGEALPEDQCIFDPIQTGPDEESGIQLIPIPAESEYRDPLHILLELIAEEASYCDMFLVHDNDLVLLDGIHDSEGAQSLESLQLDALLSHLRKAMPKIHQIPFDLDLSSANYSICDATDTVWVAALSTLSDETSLGISHTNDHYLSQHVGRPSHVDVTQHADGLTQAQPHENRHTSATSSGVPHNVLGMTTQLLIDGYVSYSFDFHRAQQYFLDLLKSDSIPQSKSLSFPNREGHHFFIVSPHIRGTIENPFDMSSRPLDRAIANRGTVVPQTMWSPPTVTDKRQYGEEANLQMPIFFEGIDGRLGLSLESAAAGRCHSLRDAQQFAPLGHKSTTHIRIHWLGYKYYKRQVQIRDETAEHNPVTISRFAHHIGRSVDAFLKACEPDPWCTDSKREQWQIGTGGIQRSDIIIIGAVHVSAGSWMPILQLNRYIF